VCGVRRASSLGQAVTLILEAIPDQPANQYLLRSVFLRLRGGGGDPAVVVSYAVGDVGFRAVFRAVRATFRPVFRATRATFRPVFRSARATFRPVFRATRATFRPVFRAVRAVLRAVVLVVAIVSLPLFRCLHLPVQGALSSIASLFADFAVAHSKSIIFCWEVEVKMLRLRCPQRVAPRATLGSASTDIPRRSDRRAWQ
jgi:hypothetical protein